MDLPQPPPDQELKNIIDKLAQFVARNGPEFEQMTKSKQKDNPKFSFLFGGDYFNYYQYKVTTEQAIIKHRQQHQPPQHMLPPPQQNITTVSSIQTTPQTYLPPIATYPTAAQYPNYSYPPSSLHQQPPFPPSSQPPVGYAGYPPSSQPSPYASNNGDARHDNFSSAPPPRYPDQYDQQPHPQEPALHQQPPPPLPPSSDSYQNISNSMANVSVSSSSGIESANFSVHPPGETRNPYSTPSLPDQPPPTSQFSQSVPVAPVQDAAAAAAAAAAASASNAAAIESIVQQQQTLQEQIKQSEQNLTAQHQVLQQQKDSQIKEGLYVAKGETLKKEAEELNLVESELSELLSTITETCTKDSISAGKLWIFTHATDEPRNNWIAQYLNYKATCHSAPFAHKLHIIYLMNDVLHSCVRKGSVELKERLQQVLVPMFCHAATSAPEDKKAKLEKLLSLWEGKLKLEDHILVQLQNPKESWAALEKRHLDDFPQVIQTITHHLDTTFEGYKQQHNAFVQHAATQLQQLEQQKQQLEQQQHQQQAVAAAQVAVASLAASHQQLQQPPPPQPALDHLSIPPPGFGSGAPAPPVPMVDFSRPPPGFPGGMMPPDVPPPLQQPPPNDVQKENLVPSIPYFELPAGLMCPMVAEEDTKYKPLDPTKIRLPAPAPPTERLLRAVDNFYLPPSHERPRNSSEGWEQLSLYDYYKGKSEAVKRRQDAIDAGEREQSESPPPVVILTPPPDKPDCEMPLRRYSSVSPEKDVPEQLVKPNSNGDRPNRSPVRSPGRELYSPSRSPRSERRSPRSERRSPQPMRRSPRRSPPSRRSPRRSPRRSRSRSASPESRSPSGSASPSGIDRVPFRRSPSRSPTPPSFGGASFAPTEQRLSETNKGHQMLRKMGWGGSGLGVKEQGIENPIDAGDVRDDPQERFRGLGVPTAKTDPFEAFRKNKGKAFITRMKARAEEKL